MEKMSGTRLEENAPGQRPRGTMGDRGGGQGPQCTTLRRPKSQNRMGATEHPLTYGVGGGGRGSKHERDSEIGNRKNPSLQSGGRIKNQGESGGENGVDGFYSQRLSMLSGRTDKSASGTRLRGKGRDRKRGGKVAGWTYIGGVALGLPSNPFRANLSGGHLFG